MRLLLSFVFTTLLISGAIAFIWTLEHFGAVALGAVVFVVGFIAVWRIIYEEL